MELTREQYAVIENIARVCGVRIESVIFAMQKYEVYLLMQGFDAMMKEILYELKGKEYEYCESILLQERGPLPPYRPKIMPGKGYKNRIYWKRIRSNPKQR